MNILSWYDRHAPCIEVICQQLYISMRSQVAAPQLQNLIITALAIKLSLAKLYAQSYARQIYNDVTP